MRTVDGENFGKLLRRYRLAAALSQEELSALSGLSVRTIGFLEAGRTLRPYRHSVRMLADALALAEADAEALMRAAGRGGAADPVSEQEPAGSSGVPAQVADGGPAVRPAELPPDIAEFTGRTGLIAHLTGLLPGRSPDGPVPVVIITGPGGAGKSVLAVHVAHQLRREFGDGQMFVELHGSGDDPVASTDVLARLLRQLGMPDAALPADEAERAAAYRTRMADRQILVVLDDARDAAQVRRLLPGTSSSAVLITSRSRLADLEGCQRVVLGELGEADALALFACICGPDRVLAEPAATRAVLTACAGLPLAIRIAGARLVSRPGWKIGMLAGRLADQRHRLEELSVGDLAVRASFQVSYAALPGPGTAGPAGPFPDDCRRAFRLLGLWPGPDISLPAAAALLGLDARSAFRVLERLVDVHLLEVPAEQRYRFHNLIGAFASECASGDEPPSAGKQAIRRLLSWYMHSAEAALTSLQLAPRRPFALATVEAGVRPLVFTDHDSAAGWTDAERVNISCAVMLASRLGLQEVYEQLAEVTWRCQLHSPWGGWTSVLDRGPSPGLRRPAMPLPAPGC